MYFNIEIIYDMKYNYDNYINRSFSIICMFKSAICISTMSLRMAGIYYLSVVLLQVLCTELVS